MLIQRGIKICSDEKFLDRELGIIRHNLCEVNNYPRKFVQNIINCNLHKRNNIAPNLHEGNNSKEIFINLKFAGQKGEKLMSKRKNTFSNTLEDGFTLKVVYKSSKLSQYFNVKDHVP